jgi:cytochrome c-type biogenesis protein CcmH
MNHRRQGNSEQQRRGWWPAGLGLAFVLLAWLLASAPAAQAQAGTPGPVTDDQVNHVAKKLYCPVCENIPLDVCPTTACIQWRGTIREKLEAGWSEQQILDYFVAQYGERVLARPSARGLNAFIWVLPPVIVVGGGLLMWRFMRQAARAGQAARPAANEADQEVTTLAADVYAQRLEQELRKRL